MGVINISDIFCALVGDPWFSWLHVFMNLFR